jgi:cellulose synthase/poly-beta-1,6-N-acetylglucosamine synthase-like glycosyltransferase
MVQHAPLEPANLRRRNGNDTAATRRRGERTLAASLSLLLPVCNAQKGLETQVERVLDVLPDLSDRFDVVIIDDASTDETHEVAADLARRYPQVEVVRHPVRRGVEQAIQTGRGRSKSDVVLVHASDEPLDAAKLATLWSTSSAKVDRRDRATHDREPAAKDQRRRIASTARD